MCLACQMEDEGLWLAYLDQMAQKAAEHPVSPAKPAFGTAEVAPAEQAQSAAPFVCEELPPE